MRPNIFEIKELSGLRSGSGKVDGLVKMRLVKFLQKAELSEEARMSRCRRFVPRSNTIDESVNTARAKDLWVGTDRVRLG